MELISSSSPVTLGCFYSVRLQVGETGKTLRIISLNGLPYSPRNRRSNSSDPDPLGQFQWLVTQLQSARLESQKVGTVLNAHLDPLTRGLYPRSRDFTMQDNAEA